MGGTREPEGVFAALAAARAAGRPLALAQLGQSLDGRIATPAGDSHYVNGRAAIAVLHRLRAAVDAVVVGAGTAASDDPRLTVRHAEGPNPARVLIDPRRRAGAALRMLAPGARRVVFGPPLAVDPAGVECIAGECPPAAILAALAARGLARVLVEGGADTVSRFVAADALDRLVVFVAPLVIGAGPIGLSLPPVEPLAAARRPAARVTVLADGDVMFDCALRPARRGREGGAGGTPRGATGGAAS